MDHRIAKDMISSGMIPSGEKKQDDLNKIQYGTVPSPNALSDVYKMMYEHHKKDADGNTIPHEGEEINEAPVLAALAPILKIAGKTAVKAGVKLGGKTGGAIAKSIVRNPGAALNKAAMVAGGAQMVGGMMPKSSIPAVEKKKSSGGMVSASPQYASADLFDIVKGQLLDEGLSEEEIKDIMLTLTPDEILNEISAETALAASKARDVQAGKLKGPENTEKRAELRAKASQNYDRAVEKRKSGFVKNTASPQGPSRIPTGGM